MRTTGRKRLERESGHVYKGGRGGKGRKQSPASDAAKPRSKGNELTHYRPRHDPMAIPICKLAKKGDRPRKIAKQLGISIDRVKAVLE